MTYNHAVKYNGVIYPTGTEVPEEVQIPDNNTKDEETEIPVDDKAKENKKK